ncbi:MAG: DUF4184 family protein [bacterium]|nr:DUF4184 family protein [bacterium]
MFAFTHFGPSLSISAIKPKFFNFWALLLGSVLMDGENVYLSLINIAENCPKCPHHSFFHSILGAVIGSLILAYILFKFSKLLLRISPKQPFSFSVLFFSGLIGWLTHIFADALVHKDVFLFWPLQITPLLISWKYYWPLSYAFTAMGIIAIAIILFKTIKNKHE